MKIMYRLIKTQQVGTEIIVTYMNDEYKLITKKYPANRIYPMQNKDFSLTSLSVVVNKLNIID